MMGARVADGRVAINHSVARLIEELQRHAPGCRICLPIVPSRNGSMNHVLDIPPEDVVALPPMTSIASAQKYRRPVRRILRDFARTVELLFVRVPFGLPDAVRNLGLPKLIHIVGHPSAIVNASSDYRGFKRWLAKGFAKFLENRLRALVAEPNTRLAANGQELWNLMQGEHGRVVVSSCLSASEMEARPDVTLHEPPRLLFVGYLRPEKGVATLLQAFDQLRAKRPLKLTLVGGSDRITSAEQLIRDRVHASPYRADIELLGHLDFGEPLFAQFRQHDLFVLPSLSEGTPRALVEARAFGCPSVASRVGGIPQSVQDGADGLLFTAGDAPDLANKIARVLDDHDLRRRLSDVGYRRSRELFSLEHFAGQLLGELKLLENQYYGPTRS